MVYSNKQANIFTCEGRTMLLQLPQSTIGYTYPRLFFRQDGKPWNFDLSINMIFAMKEKDWDDWMSDAVEITEEEAWEVLKKHLKEDGFRAELRKFHD